MTVFNILICKYAAMLNKYTFINMISFTKVVFQGEFWWRLFMISCFIFQLVISLQLAMTVKFKSFVKSLCYRWTYLSLYIFCKNNDWFCMRSDPVFFISFFIMRIWWWWNREFEFISLVWIMILQVSFFFSTIFINIPDFNYVLHEKICAHELLK